MERIVKTESLVFPNMTEHDGIWYGMMTASDGTIYVCPCGHGGTAHLFEYVPSNGALNDLGDMADVTHEGHLWGMRQGKIHSEPVEAPDGRLYFATYYGNPQDSDYDGPESYPGGHWVVYDPKTRLCTDLGIPRPHEGLTWFCLNWGRDTLYGNTVPGWNWVTYDLSTGAMGNLGRIGGSGSMVSDRQGCIYQCPGPGVLMRYSPKSRRAEELHLPLVRPSAGAVPSQWRWAKADSSGRFIYGFEFGGTLFRYDTENGPEGKIEALGLWTSDEGAERFATMGQQNFYCDPAAKLVGDRTIYGTAPAWGSTHFVSFDLERRERTDYGRLTFEDDLSLLYAGGFAVGADGDTMYACGPVYQFVKEQASPQVRATLGKHPHMLRFLKWRLSQLQSA